MSEQEILDAVEGVLSLRTRRPTVPGDTNRYNRRLQIDRLRERLRTRRALLAMSVYETEREFSK